MEGTATVTALVLVLPGTHALDLAGPVQVLGAVDELGLARVHLRYAGPRCDARLYQGLAIGALEPLPDSLPPDSLIIVPGGKWHDTACSDDVSVAARDWLRTIGAGETVDVVAVCTGAFLLAEAGILRNRRCTTHHSFLDRLAARHPEARVLTDRLFVRDDRVTTSAGVSSGIDTMVEVVRERFGELAAVLVAQDLAMYMRRTATDPQHSELLKHRNHVNAAIHRVQNLLLTRPEHPWPIPTLAREANLSPRHLTRLFRTHAGVSIKDYHTMARLERARTLLRHSRVSIEEISREVGFEYPQNFRRAWRKRYGKSPGKWRAESTESL
jgi:transcriptional regulator GlxA family with amidase domain